MPFRQQTDHDRRRNVFEERRSRPFKRAIDIVRNRVHDLTTEMNRPAFLDQYPANTVNHAYSLIFDLGLLTARRNGVVGFEGLAPVVDLANFLRPRNGQIHINREGPFYWCRTNIVGYASLTYSGVPGNGGAAFTDQAPTATVGDIFDPVFAANGGAETLNYFFSNVLYDTKPNMSFDLQLYDTKRNRKLHEGTIPPQLLTAQGYANKKRSSPMRFAPNTEVEVRLRPLEVRMRDLLDTTQAFNAALFRGYINVTLLGYRVLA